MDTQNAMATSTVTATQKTLLELLIEELPKHGGWPDGYTTIATDESNYAWAYTSNGRLAGRHMHLYCRDRGCVTRDQYEAALAASQQPVWDGEGLPPVGVDVLAYIHKDNSSLLDWRQAKVVWAGYPGSADEVLVFDIETTKPTWTDEFRPIRTEAERKREEAIDAINMNLDDMNEVLAASIYDAIAAGKIPGVALITIPKPD